MSNNSLEHPHEITLRHDINFLLFEFNKLDIDETGYISKQDLTDLFAKLKVAPQNHSNSNEKLSNDIINHNQESTFNLKPEDFDGNDDENYLDKYTVYKFNDDFQFEMMLSLLGNIEHPNQPALYVLSFVKILAGYRNKCIQKDDSPTLNPKNSRLTSQNDDGLREAKEIDTKIRKIIKRELERQKERMLQEHKKIYDEMEVSQRNQYYNFEAEWKMYLEQFQSQTQQKLRKTKQNKLRELTFESEKLIKTSRRNSLTTSPKLQELLQKKKRLVKQSRYSDAIKINHLIENEKRKIQEHQENMLDFTLRRRIKSLKKKNEGALSYIQSQLKTDMGRLMAKKKQGENLMKIRMKNLQQEAHRKLGEHLRSQLSRLRGAFSRAAR